MTLEDFRRARSRAKHAAILDAALLRFRADGYRGAAMEAIAREANVSTATLYRHFASKADLFEAVAAASVDTLQANLPDEQADPLVRLRLLAHHYADMLADPALRSVVRMHVAEAGRHPELGQRFYKEIKIRLGAVFTEAVESSRRAGIVKEGADPLQLRGMIEHGTLLYGLILGDDAQPAAAPHAIAQSALETWLARWGQKTA